MRSFLKVPIVLFLSGILFIFIAEETRAVDAGKFVPPAGKVLFIIGQDKPSIDAYVNALGVVPGGNMLYTSVQETEGLDRADDHGGGLQDGQHLVKAYPHSVLQIGLWMVGALDGIAQGEYDQNIDAIGRWIHAAQRPVFLRIGYEFDLPANGYEPGPYVQAFRHIVDRLRKNGVDNVAFVWHSFASLPRYSWEEWYPGDAYVDWFAVSIFTRPNIYMKKFAELAAQHHKPLMVAESTPQGLGARHGASSWKYWFEDLFRFVAEQNVKVLCYIDYDWEAYPMFKGQGWGDARVQADEVVKAKWLEEILQDKYLQASSELFALLGYRNSVK